MIRKSKSQRQLVMNTTKDIEKNGVWAEKQRMDPKTYKEKGERECFEGKGSI